MKKFDFFLAAMAAMEYKRKAWIVSAFALIQEGPDAWKTNPYPYRVVQLPTGHFFVDPNNGLQLTKIDDAKPGQPPLDLKEAIQLKANTLPNQPSDITTSYRQALVNYILLVFPFYNKIPYMSGKIKIGTIENAILPRFQDNPLEDEARDPKFIYVDEYLKFTDAAMFLAELTQLCVPAATPKTMVPPKGIHEYRKKLLEEYKDRLHDPATIAVIDKKLVEYDREYMKDDLAMGFLTTDKSFEVVRKKMFGMHGAETGLAEKIDVDLIKNSLSEGWDITKFPAMNNSLRAGSFNRGAQTMLGGEAVKWLLRASSNIVVTVDDCGSKLGVEHTVVSDNLKYIVGFSIIVGTELVKIPDPETAAKYVGKKVYVRSPMYCHLDKTDYCKTCVGDRLSMHPTALSTAISEYGSAFLYIFMKLMHGKSLSLAKMDYKKAIS